MFNIKKVSLCFFFILSITSAIAGSTANGFYRPFQLNYHIQGTDSTYIKTSLDSLELLILHNEWNKALEKSLILEEYAHEHNDLILLSYIYSTNGAIYHIKGELNCALISYQASLQIEEQSGNSMLQASLLNSIGTVYTDMGYFSNGLKNLYNGLKIAEQYNDRLNQSNLLYSISQVFLIQEEFDNSQYLLNQAQGFARNIQNTFLIPRIHKAMGDILAQEEKYSEATFEYQQALKRFSSYNDSIGIANTYSGMGSLSCLQGRYKESLDYFHKSIGIQSRNGYQKDLMVSYYGAAKVFSCMNILDKALLYASKSMEFAQQFNMLYLQYQSADIIANIYEQKGDYRTALQWVNKSKKVHDSIFSINNTRLIVQFENSYEVEKLIQKQRVEQEKKDLLMEEQGKRNLMVRRYLIFSSLLIFLTLMATLYGYNQKRKHSFLLQEQNEEIKTQNEEIKSQNEEIETQRENLFLLNEELLQKNEVISRNLEEIKKHRNSLANLAWELQERTEIIEKQRDELFHQKKGITDSIIYAERIQRALLPPIEDIKHIFSDAFVFHRPKNIISGDFYWVNEIRGFKLFAVADCTGHGVPGGIMSMLGMAFLNDILNKEYITKSSAVLEEMRDRIIHSLRQYKNDIIVEGCSESYDGMDMAMCALNTKTMELQYSGAYLPIYIFKNNGNGSPNPIVVREDRMPVSQHIKTDPFFNHSITVEPGDMIYLFSDGYSDQFSHDGNKFNISRFRNLLSSIYHLEGEKQHEILANTFEEWKGDHFQVDDVLVMGIRI